MIGSCCRPSPPGSGRGTVYESRVLKSRPIIISYHLKSRPIIISYHRPGRRRAATRMPAVASTVIPALKHFQDSVLTRIMFADSLMGCSSFARRGVDSEVLFRVKLLFGVECQWHEGHGRLGYPALRLQVLCSSS
jgi:hypothetical protein